MPGQRGAAAGTTLPAWKGVAVAVAAVAVAWAITALLWPLVQPSSTPLFFAAVAVSSWYGGLRPGLLATGLAGAIVETLFFPPYYALSWGTAVRLVSFVVVAWLVASLYDRARRAQIQAERLATSRQALLVQEQAARAEAETASRAKDEFLATLSHELRTPLNALMGWVWWLRKGDLEPARAVRALETIDRNTKSLAQLIEDLLDVSRITTGKLRLDIRPTEMVPAIEAALEAIRPAADARRIDLDLALDGSIGIVQGDPDRLQQVMWNLLSNAVKFTPEGGRVQVRLERVPAGVRIQVRDTGRGIAPESLPYIFDRFHQGDNSAKGGHGLGLGLAIVRHLVELHGGTIRAESAGIGQGATFTLVLPMQAAAPPPPAVPVSPAGAGPRPLAGLAILIVEDSADDRDWLARTLGAFGALVVAASSVPDAVAALDRDRPDIVISDLRLPGEDGYDLIRRIRSHDRTAGRQTPAIAITAYARVEDRTRALDAGYQMHVPKPVDPDELIAVVASLAGRNLTTTA
jgi:signal transduction histidine kinase/ActR/RegA family two-component response regulator